MAQNAIGKDFQFIEIDSIEYFDAKCDFYKYNLLLEDLQGFDNLKEEFLYYTTDIDEEAKDIFVETDSDNENFWYRFKFVICNDLNLIFLNFVSPIKDFTYLAVITANQNLVFSDKKIDSAHIIISRDGYIAGFEETVDAYYANLNIY